MNKLTLPSALLLFLCFIIFTYAPVRAQLSEFNQIYQAMSAGDVLETERLLDNSSTNVRKKDKRGVSIFNFAQICDDQKIFIAIMRRALPLTPNDLEEVAEANSKFFILALRSTDFKTLQELQGGQYLLSSLSSGDRKIARKLLLSPELPDERIDRTPEVVDIQALEIWIQKLETEVALNEVNEFLTGVALEFEATEPSNGSAFLIEKYLFNQKGYLGKDYKGKHLAKIFEQGKWRMVDNLLARGAPLSDLDLVNPAKLKDPERALGYFVRSQLIDIDPSKKFLQSHRGYKPPSIKVIFPGKGKDNVLEKKFELIDSRGSYSFGIWAFPYCFTFNGLISGQLTRVRGFFDGPFDIVAESVICGKEVRIIVPQTDPANFGEYHSLRIVNQSASENALIKGVQPLHVYINENLIETIPVMEEATVNRSLGPTEIRTKLFQYHGFSISGYFGHQFHPKIAPPDIRDRVKFYRDLMRSARENGVLSAGSPKALDARTFRRLTPEQLVESGVISLIRESLRVQMQSLAEQSHFDALFTSFLLDETFVLEQELPDALEKLLESASPTVRQQVEELQKSLDKKSTALRLLNQENIRNYENQFRRMENLLYEFGQYYQREELIDELRKIFKDLSPEHQKGFVQNVSDSLSMFKIKSEDLNNKGGEIQKFLKF